MNNEHELEIIMYDKERKGKEEDEEFTERFSRMSESFKLDSRLFLIALISNRIEDSNNCFLGNKQEYEKEEEKNE